MEGRRRVALLGSMPTEDSTHQAYHAAGGGKQRAPRVRPRSGCLRLERAWRMASRGSGGTKVLGKSKVPGEPNEKSNRGSHEGPDRCEASPPKHECEHLSARSETPFCVTAVCVCVATPGRGAVLIASMPAGAAPGPGGKSLQVTAFAGRLPAAGATHTLSRATSKESDSHSECRGRQSASGLDIARLDIGHAANQPSRHPILGRSTLGYLGHPLVHGGADRRPSRETV